MRDSLLMGKILEEFAEQLLAVVFDDRGETEADYLNDKIHEILGVKED